MINGMLWGLLLLSSQFFFSIFRFLFYSPTPVSIHNPEHCQIDSLYAKTEIKLDEKTIPFIYQ